jgi:uncharacterized membrane protein YwzB
VLSGSFILFVLWGLGPILLELFTKSKDSNSIALLILLLSITVIALFSVTLWLPTEKVNGSPFIKWMTIALFILASLAILIFVYSSWVLLVVFLAVDFVWMKRLIKGETKTQLNLTSVTVVAFLLSMYLFFALVY